MGAANAKICNTTGDVFLSQHNFSDHGLLFPTVYHLAANNTITLQAGADARGLRFGIWREGWTRQRLYEAKNGSEWRILQDTIERWDLATEQWVQIEPYRVREVSRKSQLTGKCILCWLWCKKKIIQLGKDINKNVDLDELDKQIEDANWWSRRREEWVRWDNFQRYGYNFY